MNQWNEEELRRALQKGFPAPDPVLRKDLWPRMLRKLDSPPSGGFWLDWVLLALFAAGCLVFPGAIPGLFYHL